jgi:hypothetical protein
MDMITKIHFIHVSTDITVELRQYVSPDITGREARHDRVENRR